MDEFKSEPDPQKSITNFNIERRFSEFEELYKNLSSISPVGLLPNFPQKNFFGRFDSEIVEQRRSQFEKILNVVSKNKQLRKSQHLIQFCKGVPQSPQSPQSPQTPQFLQFPQVIVLKTKKQKNK